MKRRGPRFVYQGDGLTDKYLVVWQQTTAHRTATVYYQGWQQQYGEPMYSPNKQDALIMSRSGAQGAAARLRDLQKWGVEAKAIRA